MKRNPSNGEIEEDRWGNEMLLGWRRDGTWIANGEVYEGNRDILGKYTRLQNRHQNSSWHFHIFKNRQCSALNFSSVIASTIKNESSWSFYLLCPSFSSLPSVKDLKSVTTCLHNDTSHQRRFRERRDAASILFIVSHLVLRVSLFVHVLVSCVCLFVKFITTHFGRCFSQMQTLWQQ